MHPLSEQAQYLNRVIAFLAQRDVEELTKAALREKYGLTAVDTLILLGSSALPVMEAAARAYRDGLAKEVLISGGIGHSTQYLIENIRRHPVYCSVITEGVSEAEMMAEIMVQFLNVPPAVIRLETQSTNCGGNAEESYRKLAEAGSSPRSLLLMQDPTMQRRTDASFRRVWGTESEVLFVNYAALVPLVEAREDHLTFCDPTCYHIWQMDRFLSLVMGEIPRLMDNEHGYGPHGKGFIAHVDIPAEVLDAYDRLLPFYREQTQKRAVD
jgi:uncharacterized SAM-binding protein YcdF (DUF218 family)